MKYDHYHIKDFVVDLDFIQWVTKPTKESDQFWRNWLQNHPEKKSSVEEARLIVLSIKDGTPQPAISNDQFIKSKNYVKAQLQHVEDNSFKKYYRWAAVISLLLISAYLVFSKVIFNNHIKYYSTSYGETRQIVLPDHSIITLNANSTLEVPVDWSKLQAREVSLKGEAFFEISEMQSGRFPQKFLIHTSTGLDIKVLGTSFNVNDRKGKAEVVLNTGKVELSNEAQENSVKMIPGESITYSAKSNKYYKKIVNPEEYSLWTKNQLAFEDESLQNIINRIEEIFGLKIVFENFEVKGKRFTGSTPYDDIEILLLTIAKSYNLDYQRDSEEIILKKKQPETK